jgi:hypothetical protein
VEPIGGQTSRPRWLVLTHELPSRPSNARVLTWRRLKAIGAIPLRSSVYLLPNTDACATDFEWVRGQIATLRGKAVVFVADTADPADTTRLVDVFRRTAAGEYRRLIRDVERLRVSLARQTRRGRRPDGRQRRAVRRLHERRDDIARRDFFRAEGRDALEAAMGGLESHASGEPAESQLAGRTFAEYQARTWVTRPRPGVDRMASAWLIRRFIDPRASFGFGSPAAGAITFDMPEGDFTHRGSLCTFEVLVVHFQVRHPVVRRLAQLVHSLDLKDDQFAVPEAAAVDRLITALRMQPAPDGPLLEQGIALFDALAASLGGSVTDTTRHHAAAPAASRTTSRR